MAAPADAPREDRRPKRKRRKASEAAAEAAEPAEAAKAAEAAEPEPAATPRRKKRARKASAESAAADAEAAAAGVGGGGAGGAAEAEAGEADEGGLAALLRLRAMLAPAEELPAPGGGKTSADGEAAQVKGPDWTSRYHVVNASDAPTPLEDLSKPLHPALDRALRKAGFKTVFPIQAAVIPLLSRSAAAAGDADSPHCCDVCVSAPTGQGKTLAYAVPIVEALLGQVSKKVRALVLLPTRDLALQVFRVFELLRQGLGAGVRQVRAQCLVGARPFAEEQRLLAAQPPDVVVCTPGRLADHFLGAAGRLDLSALRWFVVDEADRLLTQAYHRWLDVLERVCAPAPELAALGALAPARRPPQKLLLSATMTWNPQKLAMLKLRRPLYFFSSQSGQHATPAELRQYYLKCKPGAKPLALLHLLCCVLRGQLDGSPDGAADGAKVVVFCGSVDTAHRLARSLQICALMASAAEAGGAAPAEAADDASGEEAEASGAEEAAPPPNLNVPEALCQPGAIAEFSSTLAQRDRTALLRRFRRSQVRCLVCSDVVARGIDIPEVSAVVNYSPPTQLQTYIHRVGRTARAGRTGHTFTFVPNEGMDRFKKMLQESADCWERIKKYPLPKEARDTSRPWYTESFAVLKRAFSMEETGRLSAAAALTREDLAAAQAPEGTAHSKRPAPVAVEEEDDEDAASEGSAASAGPASGSEAEAEAEAEAEGEGEGEEAGVAPKAKPRTSAERTATEARAGEGLSLLDYLVKRGRCPSTS